MRFISLLITLHCLALSAQNDNGKIEGVVSSEILGDPLSYAKIYLIDYRKDSLSLIKDTLDFTYTDLEGNYKFERLDSGDYSILVSYKKYTSKMIFGINIKNNTQYVHLSLGEFYEAFMIDNIPHSPPLFRIDKTTIEENFDREEIQRLANF